LTHFDAQWPKRHGIAKEYAFGGTEYLFFKFDHISHKNVKILPKNWQFQAKMLTHESQSVSESTKPIDLKI